MLSTVTPKDYALKTSTPSELSKKTLETGAIGESLIRSYRMACIENN